MTFDLVRFALLTLVAADLEADLSSAREAVSSFWVNLVYLKLYSTGSDVPTTLTSDYQSYSSALSSFNEALEGVGADDLDSGSTLYQEAAMAFLYMGYVIDDMIVLADLHDNKTGNIFSYERGLSSARRESQFYYGGGL